MKKTILALSLAALAGCASNATIIPQVDGQYKSVAQDYEKNAALKTALKSARKTCGEISKRHVVIDTQTEYSGMLSEKNREMADTALVLAGVGWVSGNNDDYQVTVTFDCV